MIDILINKLIYILDNNNYIIISLVIISLLMITYYIKQKIVYNIDNIIKNNYIYNLSWEDPRNDIKIYGSLKNKNICMITTGGDNVLDYLIEGPKSIYTFDLNKHQNYLLEMKMSCIKALNHEDCFEIIGNNNYELFLNNWVHIKKYMSPGARKWWGNNKKIMKKFIYSGSVKYLVFILNILFYIFKINDLFVEIYNNPGIENQKQIYKKYEKKISYINYFFNKFDKCIIHFIGVPIEQYNLYKNNNFVNELFKYWIENTDIINDNYFYYGYLYGRFSKDCCPRYLKKEFYDIVKQNLNKVHIYTKNLCDLNQDNVPDDLFDINILLDHMDWIDEKSIRYELTVLQKYSKKSCKYCWRSYSVNQHISFLHSSKIDRINPNKYSDRVGTYNSIHVVELSNPIIN